MRKPFNYSKLSFYSDEGNRRVTENVVLSLYLFRSDTIIFKLLQEQLASKWLRAYKYKQFIEKENFKGNCKSLRKIFQLQLRTLSSDIKLSRKEVNLLVNYKSSINFWKRKHCIVVKT